MRLNKKILSFVLATGLLMSSTITAYAATPEDITASLKNAGATSEQITKAQDYLGKNTVDAKKLDDVKAQIDSVTALLKKNCTTDVTKLSAYERLKVLDAINKAATDVGLRAVFIRNTNNRLYVCLKDSKDITIYTFNRN